MKLIFFKRIVLGVIAGALFSLFLLLLSALFLSSREDPSKQLSLFSEISLLAGAFMCGKISTWGLESKALQGALSSLAYTLAILLPSLILSNIGSGSLLNVLLTIVFAFTGAMLGRKSTQKQASGARRKNVIRRYAH